MDFYLNIYGPLGFIIQLWNVLEAIWYSCFWLLEWIVNSKKRANSKILSSSHSHPINRLPAAVQVGCSSNGGVTGCYLESYRFNLQLQNTKFLSEIQSLKIANSKPPNLPSLITTQSIKTEGAELQTSWYFHGWISLFHTSYSVTGEKI